MNALDLVVRIARNNAWSNHRLLHACGRLSKGEYEAARTSFFPSIPQTLNHILIVDWFYVDALTDGKKGRAVFADEMPFGDFEKRAELIRAQREIDFALIAFVSAIENESALERKIRLERADHFQVESVGDTLMHLHAHQTHHRGQVHAMLSGTSVAPPQLDEFFMREEVELRRHELRELGLPEE